MGETVLLTGISGFLGGHVGLALLAAGHKVRGSVRDPSKGDKARATLHRAGADTGSLEIVTLDLLEDAGWQQAAEGCRFVVHTASPFVLEIPKDRDELIRPAVEGTRRAIGAALAAGVDRVVLTSSVAAIAYGHGNRTGPFTEADWTEIGGKGVSAYSESKTLAEREAWSLMEAAGARHRLAVINPAAILGPLLDDDPGTSGQLVVRLLNGTVPAAPRISFGIVDVRDVAALHVAAMTAAEAAGHRHIAQQTTLSFMAAARIVGEALPEHRGKLPKFQLPDWVVRAYALFEPSLRDNVVELGKDRTMRSDRAEELLGRPLIAAREAVLATARTAIANGIV